MSRSCSPLEAQREWARLHRRHLNRGRIDLAVVGEKEEVDAGRCSTLRVRLECSWVGGKVCGVTELAGIHIDAEDDARLLGACCSDERCMPVMQRAHRRHEPNGAGELRQRRRERGTCRDGAHRP